ncbi:alpha/beta hydrolase [Rhizobium halophytocola]|uniref:Pimeloyl-ACP methyl ester carboxylesterase/DNA-binding SARP family transcriptional activator n=1 Tax=Rhizobium halophytocola TaxID=735519 RepID=A0ABS4E078_9HYPH|nr:alpha/beta hydrolase [Rhizobium halophytocola]MBP1851340.1 pimeloyl-ACP methyl ester carboxylesterase/DNA-binding SARP family transcriptional activator [Rhizobium halophytocola]
MRDTIQISLLGELRVTVEGQPAPLPASRKARALLAFLVATGRPHRRERLCELFWDLPDDPKASLRWALSKLRRVVDTPERARIVADRERVGFDHEGVEIDIRDIHAQLRLRDARRSIDDLEHMAQRLEQVALDGLDGAGDEAFESWLTAEREDARVAHVDVLRQLATHPQMEPFTAQKWRRLWREADPEGAEAYDAALEAETERAAQAARTDQGTRGEWFGEDADTTPAFAPPLANVARKKISVRGQALRAQRIGFCEVKDKTKIAYATVGSGPPLLKAANWLNHLEFDWSSPIWGGSFAAISQYRTFVRYDERGCGLSDWDVKDLSFDAFVEDLETVADKLELERFPLLGISQGAAVSIEYAVRHPERVSGLILFGGYSAGWRHLASPEEQARREAVLTLTELGWGTDNPAYRHIFSKTFMPDATAADLDWFDEFQRRTASPKNAARFQDAFGHIDVRDRLSQVRAPTLVMHSKYDQRIPLEQGRALASGIPNALFVPLESRNHILVNHEPALQVCLETAGQFLQEMGI